MFYTEAVKQRRWWWWWMVLLNTAGHPKGCRGEVGVVWFSEGSVVSVGRVHQEVSHQTRP